MVRPAHVGRSRGCQPCRTRRIKCDLTLPKCKRCLESGRECPGPLTGLLVIQSKQKSVTVALNIGLRRRPQRQLADTNSTISVPDLAYSAAISRAPKLRPVYEANRLSKFIEFFARAARGSSWIFKLPQLQTIPSACILRSSLRAISLAYASSQTKDDAMRCEALEQYGQTLRQQRCRIGQTARLQKSADQAVITVTATMVLSYFELVSSTNPMAWFEHASAAEKLFIVLGPEILAHETLRQLFFSVRSHAAHRALVHGQYTIFSESAWLNTSHLNNPQSAARLSYEHVIEFILRLSKAIHWTDADACPDQFCFISMIKELELLWSTFSASMHICPESWPLFRRLNESERPNLSSVELHKNLRVLFPAMTTAYFNAAAMTLLSHMSRTYPLEAQCFDLEHHASQILACGNFVEPRGNGIACLRMMLPYSVVFHFSPLETQRQQAYSSFIRQARKDSLPGLAEVAFIPQWKRLDLEIANPV